MSILMQYWFYKADIVNEYKRLSASSDRQCYVFEMMWKRFRALPGMTKELLSEIISEIEEVV